MKFEAITVPEGKRLGVFDYDPDTDTDQFNFPGGHGHSAGPEMVASIVRRVPAGAPRIARLDGWCNGYVKIRPLETAGNR